MNAASCTAAQLLVLVAQIYTWILIAYAILSWLPDLQYRFGRYLEPFVLPLLRPLQRLIPPLGGFDLSFLVLILIIQIVVRAALYRLAYAVCYAG